MNRLFAAINHFVMDPSHQLQRGGEELFLVVVCEQLELLVWCHGCTTSSSCAFADPSLASSVDNARVAYL